MHLALPFPHRKPHQHQRLHQLHGAPPYQQLCRRDETLTDAQFVEYLESLRGKKVIDWSGWIYDVYDRSGGYDVLIAMDPPSFLWSRDIELLGLPKDQALALQKEQQVVFSGTIRDVGAFLGKACNPIEIEKATLEVVP